MHRPQLEFASRATNLMQRMLFLGLVLGAGVFAQNSWAQDAAAEKSSNAKAPVRHHALSLVGAPKFGPDFKHFDWVNPNAPKGGTLNQSSEAQTFDTLNPFAPKGVPAAGLGVFGGLLYDSLMATSPDEPSVEYCLVCAWVAYPEDYSSVTYGLRKEARFHDGKPITPEDVIFTMERLKEVNPLFGLYYKNVVSVIKTGEREVTFKFDKTGNRELPHIVGQLPILPKYYWDGENTKGEKRDLSKTTLEVPVGSGPYTIGKLEPGRYITYERVKDHWAQDIPVRVGQWNFDTIKYDYYRDRVPAFESFKAGKSDIWLESLAKAWATEYDFAAVKKGWVKKEAIAHKRVAPMQAFIFNVRRDKFKDPRVRRAIGLAFNFEEANKKLFYGQYIRVKSFFGNSELESTGLPEGRELEILQELNGEIPEDVFTKEFKNPSASTPLEHRNNLREAVRLLSEAGWDSKGGVLRDKNGQPFEVEILLVSPDFERIVLPYIEELKRIGVQARARVVDTSQYKSRTDSFDYDMIVDGFGQSNSPGNEQREFWGSSAADKPGSRNSIGIKNPAIDKLIDKVVFAKDREDLVAATRALDRVLLWNYYLVPNWHYPATRIAYWNKFGRPEIVPSQDPASTQTWWYSSDKAAELAKERSR